MNPDIPPVALRLASARGWIPAWLVKIGQGGLGGILAFAGLLFFGDPAKHPVPVPEVAATEQPDQTGIMRIHLGTLKAMKAAWEIDVRRQVIQDLLDMFEVPQERALAVQRLRDELPAQPATP